MMVGWRKSLTAGLLVSLLAAGTVFAQETAVSDMEAAFSREEIQLLEETAKDLGMIDESLPLVGDDMITYQDYIPVLMYHHFVEEPHPAGDGATMCIDEFEEQLQYFQEQGYTTIFLDELYDLIMQRKAGIPFDKKYLCITIDDGYRSNYELAFPLLQKYQMKANISVITSRIHVDYVNVPEVPKAKWSDLNEMQESGLVQIYNHTSNHLNVVDFVSTAMDNMVNGAEKTLDEKLDQRSPIRVLTYPSGVYNTRTTTQIRLMGYDLQLTTDYGVVSQNTSINKIPRITVDSGMTGSEVLERIHGAAANTFQVSTDNIQDDARKALTYTTMFAYEKQKPQAKKAGGMVIK